MIENLNFSSIVRIFCWVRKLAKNNEGKQEIEVNQMVALFPDTALVKWFSDFFGAKLRKKNEGDLGGPDNFPGGLPFTCLLI